MRTSRQLALVAGAALVVTAGIATATDAELSGPVQKRAGTSASRLASSFSVFRRPRVAKDELPATFVNSTTRSDADPALAELDLASSRRALSTRDVQLFVLRRGTDDVCLFAQHTDGGANLSCAPISSAENPATPLLSIGDSHAYGLVPDRVTEIDGDELVRGANVVATSATGQDDSLTLSQPGGATDEVSTSLPAPPPVP